jgi:hypothetical protein
MAAHDGAVLAVETTMESGVQSKAPFREKASEELTEFIVLTAYLYVCFAALIYLKARRMLTRRHRW